MVKTMKRSRFCREKGGLSWCAMALIATGVGLLLSCAQNVELTWLFALRTVFGIILIAIGYILLIVREQFKLNRWADVKIINDDKRQGDSEKCRSSY